MTTHSPGAIRPKNPDLPGAQLIVEACACLLENAIRKPDARTSEALGRIAASLREAAAMIDGVEK